MFSYQNKAQEKVELGVKWLRYTFLCDFRRLDLFFIQNYFQAIFVWGENMQGKNWFSYDIDELIFDHSLDHGCIF